MKDIETFLSKHRSIGLDTNILIAFFEANASYTGVSIELFDKIAQIQNQVWLSVISIPEFMFKAEQVGNEAIVGQYEKFLYQSPFKFAGVDKACARQASRVGGYYRLGALDSLILASLYDQGVTGFITADKHFKHVMVPEVFLIQKRP